MQARFSPTLADPMSDASQTTGMFAKHSALATTLLFGLLFVFQTQAQDANSNSVLEQSFLKPLPLATEFTDGGFPIIIGPVDPLELSITAEDFPTEDFKATGEPIAVLPEGFATPQAVRTKEICPLKKSLVCVSGLDEIWLVSARQAHLCWSDLSQVEVSLLQNKTWQPSSLDSLTSRHANEKSKTTVVYCHGNRTSLDWAQSRGFQVYQSLFQNENDDRQCSRARPPVRFVIFAWKSEQEKIRIRNDYEIKSNRALLVGKTFGKILEQFSDREMVLSGFSLGSQIILAGLSNRELTSTNLPGRYQVALIAPALDPNFVCGSLTRLPGNGLIKRTEVVANDDDLAIKAAQKLAGKKCRQWLPEFKRLARTSEFAINRIRIHTDENDISRRHSINNYYNSEKVRRVHREMLRQVHAAQTSISEPSAVQQIVPTAFLGLQIEGALDPQSSLATPGDTELTPIR